MANDDKVPMAFRLIYVPLMLVGFAFSAIAVVFWILVMIVAKVTGNRRVEEASTSLRNFAMISVEAAKTVFIGKELTFPGASSGSSRSRSSGRRKRSR